MQLEGQDETLQARVPHALYDRLTVGARDLNLDEGELVELARDPGGELVVDDVIDRAPVQTGEFIDPGTLPPPVMTDGLAPATSPAPTVFGGVLSLFVTWVAVANPDPVTYEVHVSTSSGFTPGVGTFAGESRGTLFVIRHLPGTTNPPAYGTTYFVKVIAKDADGAAAASSEDSATPEEGMAEAIVADLIAANAIIAEKLDAVLVLASTIVAGALDAGRVELGIATDPTMGGMVGIHAMAADGMTPTFMVNSDTGEVFVRGNFEFGQGSSLLANDIVEMQAQPAGSFATPILRQTAGGRVAGGSTVAASWPTATLPGATLFAIVACYDEDAAPPAFTTPAGWTLVTSSDTTSGAARMRAYKIETAASRSGAETVTLGDSVYATLTLLEYQGVGVQDVAIVTATGNSTSPAAGPTTTPTQSNEVVLAGVVTTEVLTPGFGDSDNVTGTPSGYTPAASNHSPTFTAPFKPVIRSHVWHRNIAAAATQSVAATLPDAENWIAWVVTFKAKTVGVEPPPDGFMRWYGRNVGGGTHPHVIDDNGAEASVVVGPAGQKYQLLTFTGTANPPNATAHTGVNGSASVSGLAVGDLVVGFVYNFGNTRGVHFWPEEETISVANAIAYGGFNSDTGALDHSSVTVRVTVLRRTT